VAVGLQQPRSPLLSLKPLQLLRNEKAVSVKYMRRQYTNPKAMS
jgi:hypothetical protein